MTSATPSCRARRIPALPIAAVALALAAAGPAAANTFQFDLNDAFSGPGTCVNQPVPCDVIEADVDLGGIVVSTTPVDIWVRFFDVVQDADQHLEVFESQTGQGGWESISITLLATTPDDATIVADGHLSMVMGDPNFSVGIDGNSETFSGGGTCSDISMLADNECPGFFIMDSTASSVLFHDVRLTVSDPRLPTGAPTSITLNTMLTTAWAEGGFDVGIWVPEPSQAILLLSGLVLLPALLSRRWAGRVLQHPPSASAPAAGDVLHRVRHVQGVERCDLLGRELDLGGRG